jgi:hypothetical protein
MEEETVLFNIVDIDVFPLDPQCIGGIRDGDGDCGHVEPLSGNPIS